MQAKIQRLAELIHEQTIERYHTETIKHYPENAKYPWLWENPSKVTVIPGKKYTKIDVGASGKYMVDSEGNIFGIKAYGVIHRGHTGPWIRLTPGTGEITPQSTRAKSAT
jgi:hypothetical protein